MIKKKLLVFGISASVLALCIYLYFTMINLDEKIDTRIIENDDGDAFFFKLLSPIAKEYRYMFAGYMDSIPGSDEDGDGVLSPFDLCPQFESDHKYHGCPIFGLLLRPGVDVDGDGIDHIFDHCPRTPSDNNNNKGCPEDSKFDTDGDGFLNQDDLCPGFFDIGEYHGCPVLVKSVMYNGSIHYTKDYKAIIIRNLETYYYPFVYDLNRCGFNETCYSVPDLREGWDAHAFREMIADIEHRQAFGRCNDYLNLCP